MRIVIAIDKFKGSLPADAVAGHLAAGIMGADPSLSVDVVPVADGGEGTVDAAVHAGFDRRSVTVEGPTGEPVHAALAVRGTDAVIELAAASGLDLLPGGVPAPLVASSYGTGQLVLAALDLGCTHVVLGVGGSASTDGGAGLLAALGARLLDTDGRDLPRGGAALAALYTIRTDTLDPRVAATRFTLASDVDNPLLGAHGAAAVYGPQKGADALGVTVLEGALARFVEVVASVAGPAAAAAARLPGAGAAGGVGFAALALLGAVRAPGVDLVLEVTGLDRTLEGAGLVITGEGSLDAQSLGGKTPIGVALAARRAGVPVVAVCGVTSLDAHQLLDAGFARTYPLSDLEPDAATSITQASGLLERIGRVIADDLPTLTTTTTITTTEEQP